MSNLQRDYSRVNQLVVQRYLDNLHVEGKSPHTALAYGNALRDLLKFLQGQNLLNLQHADLLQYLAGLYERGFSKSSAAHRVYAFRSFNKFCSLMGLEHSSGIRLLRLPNVPH